MNYFQTILASLRAWANQPDATEAELDQIAATLPTREEMRAEVSAEFEATIATQAARIAELEAEVKAQEPEFEALAQRAETAEAQLSELETKVAALTTERDQVAKQLTAARVAYRTKTNTENPGDENLTIPEQGNQPKEIVSGNAKIVQNPQGGISVRSTDLEAWAKERATKN